MFFRIRLIEPLKLSKKGKTHEGGSINPFMFVYVFLFPVCQIQRAGIKLPNQQQKMDLYQYKFTITEIALIY